jgi:hypothetical protein
MTLPPSLERFQHDLERAVARDVRDHRRRRRILAGGLAAAAAAAVAATLIGIGWNDGGPSASAITPAQALERARAALAVEAGSIVHVRMEGFQDNGDGTTATWVNESWRQTASPFATRSIEVSFDGVRAEQDLNVGKPDQVRVYDSTTDTIYVMDQPAQVDAELKVGQVLHVEEDGSRIVVGPDGNKLRLEKGDPLPPGSGKVLRLRNGDAEPAPGAEDAGRARKQAQARAETIPPSTESEDDPYMARLEHVLREGNAHEDGRLQVNGKEAVRYVSADGTQVYVFDAETGNPIEFTTRGEGGGTRLTFTAYEKLPLNEETEALLDLQAQHPGATVDTDPQHFEEAIGRLYAHG